MTFLQQLIDEILLKHQGRLQSICVVFPTRRAGLFFQRELAMKLEAPTWSPAIFSISDFLVKVSGQNLADELTLLFELYESYKEHFKSDDFAKFYPWGQLLLKDFDDIDKYLVNAQKLFENINDIQQIDHEFALPEEDLERLRSFWKNFFDRDISFLKNEFLNTWKHLGGIYSSFRNNLGKKGIAYEGMLYRDLVSTIQTKDLFTGYSHFIFAGFYALSPAEQAILNHLVSKGKATSYWDADSYYADDPAQEAGDFFRNNPLTEKNYLWKQDHFKTIKKNIEIAGVPLLIGQARYAGEILKSLMGSKDFAGEKTAVVLPDEKLLIPVLYSLPEDLNDINVTMGYPLHQTPLYNLFESIMILHKNSRKGSDLSFYFRDIMNVLNHPYIRLIADKAIRRIIDSFEQNFIRISASHLNREPPHPVFEEIFVEWQSVDEVFARLKKILRIILESMREQNFRFHRLDSEFVYHFFTQISRLEDLMKGSIVTDVDTFWKILREIISTVKIPFTGEPLKGLQVMGFLETRVLDFDNVIILSMNEDILPSGGNRHSFIPFNIRKAFRLPTYEEQHAVSAFHFYRLLQRAKNIFLLHNTEAKGLTTGERSRLLLQLEHELQRRYPASITISQKVVSTEAAMQEVSEIIIEKDANVQKELSKFLTDGGRNPSAQLSASGLMTYVACPLKFYFQYVAGMRELEEPEENMEAATFGKVLHKAMQNLYAGIQELNEETIAKLKLRINDEVDKAIHEEFVSISQLEGKNILLRNIIRQLIHRILEQERLQIPVRILQLEKDVSSFFSFDEQNQVKLFGIIDRVDEKQNIVRIVDYKTGRIGKKKPKELHDYFSNPDFKEQFQAMYYAFLSRSRFPGKEIKSGLFAIREMSDGIWFMNEDAPFSDEQFSDFEKELKSLLKEIFSSTTPFAQTKDEKRCRYCAFASICNRN